MTSIRRFALTIATTLAIALAVSPAVAGDSAPARPNKAAFAAKRNKFPMEAKRFQKLLNKRLERVRAKLDRALIKRGVPRAVAKRIKAELNKNASRLVRAAQKATLDGIVTKAEAVRLRKLARRLMKESRKKLNARLNKRRGKGNRDGSSRFNPANPKNK